MSNMLCYYKNVTGACLFQIVSLSLLFIFLLIDQNLVENIKKNPKFLNLMTKYDIYKEFKNWVIELLKKIMNLWLSITI